VSFRPPRIAGDDRHLMLSALAGSDLPLIRRWFSEPHVARVWGPSESGVAEISSHLTQAHIAPYLIVEDGSPIGYLQVYHANPDEFWAAHELPRETYGLDLFIGPAERLGRGLGTRAVNLAVGHLSAMPQAARLHIDPSPDNAVAIRTYEKAGFRRAGEIETPDGRCLYMILEPKRAILPANEARGPR
jgi:aminoglycoside 6'-N-acetyltransferase